MKFENVGTPRAGRQWSMSLGVFLMLLALLALAGWRGFTAISEFLHLASKPQPTPKVVPITVIDRKKP